MRPADPLQGSTGVDHDMTEEYNTRGVSNMDENEVATKKRVTRHATF